MTLRQILTILKARWLLASVIFVTVVASTMGATLLFPRLYRASATVVVDVKSDPLATTANSEEANSSYIGTQVEIATSERVATRVIKTLKFDEMPEYRSKWQQKTHGQGDYLLWLAHYVLKRVSVKSTPVSNVIDIVVEWPNPALSARLANEFAQAYIDVNVALKVEMARQYASRFEERAQKLRADLEAKQKALSDFENQTGILATDDHLDVETARLNELSSQLVAIQSQRQESQSREQQSRVGDGAVPEVLQNSVVSSLKADLSKAEARQKDLETTLGVNHPSYKSAAAEVDSLRERLAKESSSIISSFGSTTRVNQQREMAITAALQEQRQRILELKHHHDEATVLQNDVATAQRNLDAVAQRLAQSNLESSTEQTNIGVLTPAAEPSTYSSPRYLVILAIALAGGAFLAIATALVLELSDQRIRTDDEVMDLLRVPVFGSIVRVHLPPIDRRGPVPALPQLGPS